MTRSLVPPVLLAIFAGAVLAAAAVDPTPFRRGPVHKVEDFGLYWSAARINLRGEDPYDADRLWPLQQAIEPTRAAPQIPWGPPWSLGLLTPFAAADFPAARWAWLFFGLALLLGSATALWHLAGGSPERTAVTWVVALSFYPSLLIVALGQQTVFALAGVVGFLAGQRVGRPVLAGALLALTLAKPQNLVPLWAAVGLVALARRDWRTVAGLMTGGVILSLTSMAPNPAVFAQYAHAMIFNPPSGWYTPTVGTYLRLAGGGGLGVAFVPLLFALAWVGWAVWRWRANWDWFERAPGVLFACYLTTPYGWAYDQVVLLVAVVPLAARADARSSAARLTFLVAHLGLTVVCLTLNRQGAPEHTFVWLAPVLLLGWWAGRRAWGGGPLTSPRTAP